MFKKAGIILVRELTNKLYGICKNFSLFYLHIGLSSQVFLRRSHLMLLEVCLCMAIFKTCFFNAQSHFTLTALHEHFLSPLALNTRHLSCVSDGIGQCLLPQTSSLATCNSTLGGLLNGLVILRSGPPCANIFLTRLYQKSLCDIFLPPHEERRMYWEWPGLADERTIFLSTWMCGS